MRQVNLILIKFMRFVRFYHAQDVASYGTEDENVFPEPHFESS